MSKRRNVSVRRMSKKRRISIIWKVTLWYTVFLGIMAVIIVAVTSLVSGRIIQSSSKNQLISAVEDAIDEVEYEDREIEVDDDLDFLDQGIYLSVYGNEDQFLTGLVPKNMEDGFSIKSGEINTIMIQNAEWYVYENSVEFLEYGIVTIRGMMMVSTGSEEQHVMVLVLFGLSPLILLIAIVGGYLLTKRAFLPVNQMRRTVEQISSGKDLTKRVDLGEGEDELFKLGKTFDQMFERLEDAFEREKQFTSDVSHELRTPVSVIMSQCEYAMEQENGQETNEALESIYQQTVRMSKLIGQLLVLARSDQEGEKLNVESVNVSELLEVIVEDAQERAIEKRITIDTEITQNLILQGDETMLMRFFVNLITNAIHYGTEGGWVKVGLQREGDTITGYVSDNGIGIAPENQEKIWRRFYQVNPSRTSTEDSNLGLGLSMVQWITQVHQGKIFVESKIGEGSTFHFSFPMSRI